MSNGRGPSGVSCVVAVVLRSALLLVTGPLSTRSGATSPLPPGVADNQPPLTTAFLSGPQGLEGWYTGPVQVTLDATDDGTVAATFVQLDGGAWTGYAAPFSVSVDGNHTLDFYSTDTAGFSESVHAISFGIDSTPPGTSVTAIGAWN